MFLSKVPVFIEQGVNVIIETPKGSQNKYDYDVALDIFRLKKSLPMGAVFPFDFGFVPNTRADDGDPIDVLVMMDQPAYPGCLVACRLLGALEATQAEKGAKRERNDRLIAVSHTSSLYAGYNDIHDLNKSLLSEIEKFFVHYNQQQGKKFTPLKWVGAKAATRLIKEVML